MNRNIFVGILLFALAGLYGNVNAAEPQAATGKYAIDNVHSSVVFRVTHLGVSHVYGRFNQISGNFVYNAENPEESSVAVAIQTASVDTNVQKRDQHLRSPDFFNARQFPVIRFQSTNVEETDDGQLRITGELTLHGQTNPITVDARLVGHGFKGERFGYRAGLAAEFTIRRSNFGMNYMLDNNLVGDEITIMLGLEGAKPGQ